MISAKEVGAEKMHFLASKVGFSLKSDRRQVVGQFNLLAMNSVQMDGGSIYAQHLLRRYVYWLLLGHNLTSQSQYLMVKLRNNLLVFLQVHY
jgi:hypothetical protein